MIPSRLVSLVKSLCDGFPLSDEVLGLSAIESVTASETPALILTCSKTISLMSMTAIQAFLEVLAAGGTRYLFGNPGTTELPLNDALVDDPRFQYILALQEVPAMAMADGYAMASRQIGVINLHISCGLGNALGMLYNAYREGTPLLVTAGQQDRRLRIEEPILWGDMVGVTRPWTKESIEVDRPEDLPTATRRAIQVAMTPPTGPVFLSMPVDVQMAMLESADVSAPRIPNRHVRPPLEELQRASALLLAAKRPAILAGSRVTEADACDELVRVAELLGAAVIAESGTTHGRLAFPCDHPLSALGLPLWSPEVRRRLEPYDVVLVVGMDLLRQYIYHEPSRAIPEHIKLVQLDEDPRELGKNYPVEVGLIGDTKTGLGELGQLLEKSRTHQQANQAQRRIEQLAMEQQATRDALQRQIDAQKDVRPMTSMTFMNALARVLPPEVVVVEEAVTTTNTTLERLGVLKNTSGYFGHRGWALGWGLGCTLGVQLAWPERPVLGVIGEGAIMYGIQGLWSAAHHKIPATIVVPNNAQYQILKICAQQLDLSHAKHEKYEGLDVIDPEVDLVALAQSLGVRACRVSDPEELSQRVQESFGQQEPMLIDVPILRDQPGRLDYG